MKLVFNKVKMSANMTCCIVDNVAGTYLPIAHRMSDFFSKVYYHSVNQNPFPKASMDSIGRGYDNIHRVDEFWGKLDDFDIIIFPDIYFNDWGSHLRKMGKMVWGANESDQLETNRNLFRNELGNMGLPVAPSKTFVGLTNLTNYLKNEQTKWVKLSYYRGEMETFKHINMKQSEVFLKDLAYQMGPLAETMEFIVEDNIDSIAEIGYDGWMIKGNNTQNMIWGLEVKDCGYVGKASTYKDMPEPLRVVNDKFKPVLQKYGHTGFYSTEVRIGDDMTPYYTDICGRAGSPPSNTYLEMIGNWDEIIIGGCRGEVVEPRFVAKYGCEIILKSQYCNKNFLPVNFPQEYKRNVKLKSAFNMNGKDYIVPFIHGGFDMDAFGSVVVVGDNLDEIMNKALEIAGEVDAYGLDYNSNALNTARESLSRVEGALGLQF
jgi:hypothetical protein